MIGMRRLMAITAFALFLAVPLWAQHGGGHGGSGGGHAGGFGGGHAGGFSGHAGFGGGHGFSGAHSAGSRSFSGPSFSGGTASGRSFSGRSFSSMSRGMRSSASPRSFSGPLARVPSSRFLSSRNGFSRGPFLHDGFRGSRFRDGRFHNFGFRNDCFRFGCRFVGFPWWNAGYYDPWWWWDQDSNYDQDYDDNLALAAQMNQQSLEEQRMLRQEEADGDQDDYARSNPAPARPAQEKQGTPIVPATVLVFRDQHRQEVDNYAIVGQAVWVFAPRQAETIALADLDVPATVKANEDRGVTFRLPVANEAQ